MRSALITALFGAVIAAGPAMAADTVEATPKRGGTLTYMIPADAPPSLDGHRETTFATVHATAPFYSVLIRVNPDNPSDRPPSSSAISAPRCPKPTDDGKTYTFKIRKGVKFHDGSPLTAAGRGGELEQDHLPAARACCSARAELVVGWSTRSRRPIRRTVVFRLKFATDDVPAGARRSLCLHLQEGDPRQGSALVREEHHGLRPVQVRQPTRSASRSRASATPTTTTRASPISTASSASSPTSRSVRVEAIRADRAAMEFRGLPPSARDQLVEGTRRQGHRCRTATGTAAT